MKTSQQFAIKASFFALHFQGGVWMVQFLKMNGFPNVHLWCVLVYPPVKNCFLIAGMLKWTCLLAELISCVSLSQ